MPLRKTYIVEHLDPELGPWSELEYIAIARETGRAGGTFVLSSMAPDDKGSFDVFLFGGILGEFFSFLCFFFFFIFGFGFGVVFFVWVFALVCW